MWKVTYAIDSLDPNPDQFTFETEWEALEFVLEEINRRVQFQVDHSQYAIDETEWESIREVECSLVRIERID